MSIISIIERILGKGEVDHQFIFLSAKPARSVISNKY